MKMLERDSFWVIGDIRKRVFLGTKGNGCYYGTSLIGVAGLEDCEKFCSYQEACRAMRDEDIRYWRNHEENPKDIRPVRIVRTYACSVRRTKKKKEKR